MIRIFALDVERSLIMLVRIALNLSDMQKQENVDSVMRNLQIRKKLRATKIHLAMSVSNKNARI